MGRLSVSLEKWLHSDSPRLEEVCVLREWGASLCLFLVPFPSSLCSIL